MPTAETTEIDLVRDIAKDVNLYLDHVQRKYLLWADVDNHIAASYIAESLGDCGLVARHLQTVTCLLAEIQHEYPVSARSRRQRRFAGTKPSLRRHKSCLCVEQTRRK